jgi:hypothetical protein
VRTRPSQGRSEERRRSDIACEDTRQRARVALPPLRAFPTRAGWSSCSAGARTPAVRTDGEWTDRARGGCS